MTREEQIIEAGAYHYCGLRPPKTCGHNMNELSYVTRSFAFEAGAKWADENPKDGMVSLDRACEYLESVLECYLGYYRAAEFADNFRKAMEE